MRVLLAVVAFVVVLGLGIRWLSSLAPHPLKGLSHQLAANGAWCAQFTEMDTIPAFACDTAGLQTIPGYRFVLEGDFNGDGKRDRLVEHFTDGKGKETGKYFTDGDNVYTNQCLEAIRNPRQYFKPVGFRADSLPCLYICFAQNLGDLDGNGTDEVGFVSTNNDYSSCSGFEIYTLKKKRWELVLDISTWEWMFPPTPQSAAIYYPFGHMKDTLIRDDSLNRALEAQLKSFSYVKKIRNNIIEFEWRNDSLETPYISVSSAVTIRYDLKNKSFKIKFPEEMKAGHTAREIDSLYEKVGHNEYRVEGYTYIF